MRAVRLLVFIIALAALIPTARILGHQALAGAEVLWEFKAGG
jgi:hypothetical protein